MIARSLHPRFGVITVKHGCILAFIALSVADAATRHQEIRATIDGAPVSFPDAQPMMMNNRILVPIRGVFEQMNAVVAWDESSRSVIAHHGSDKIFLPINSSYATVNGRRVTLDSPAVISMGSTMVPLRFLAETLGANVEWIAATQTVEISSKGQYGPLPPTTGSTVVHIPSGTVIPFQMNQKLTSNLSAPGDRFKAILDAGNSYEYQGLPTGSILEGHVSVARAKTGDTPGVLGLAFDRIKLPNGEAYKVFGSLIGLDSNSIQFLDGRMVAKPEARNDNLKYIGYGAGGGALISLVTKGNTVTDTLLGGALGLLYNSTQKSPNDARDVVSDKGTKFGVRLTQDLSFRVATHPSR